MKSRVKTHLPKKLNLSRHQISAILNKSTISYGHQQSLIKQKQKSNADLNSNDFNEVPKLTVNSSSSSNQNYELTKLALPNITSTFFDIIDKQKKNSSVDQQVQISKNEELVNAASKLKASVDDARR